MTDFVLTDGLIRSALRPAPPGVDLGAAVAVVSERVRTSPQRRPGFALPWLPTPAATMRELQRARLARIALAALLLAAAAGMIATGASLLPPPAAPPQWLLVQNGHGFAVPFAGGERRPLEAFAGLGINDISTSWDGTRLATVRGARNDVLQVWDAATVFAERSSSPITYTLPREVRFYDAGVWRRDGSGILLGGSEGGATRIFLLDLATGEVSRLSPDGVSVDDWQPSPNGRWIEFIGQSHGTFSLSVLDIDTRETRLVIQSDGKTIPVGGALGWSPSSEEMTVHLERNISDLGIWALRSDGSGPRPRLTPADQDAWSMSWSPDGAWIMYHRLSPDQSCARISASSSRRHDTWLVRADGTEPREIAPFAFPMEWFDEGRSVLVESQVARPDAPLGGVLRAFVDGSPPRARLPVYLGG